MPSAVASLLNFRSFCVPVERMCTHTEWRVLVKSVSQSWEQYLGKSVRGVAVPGPSDHAPPFPSPPEEAEGGMGERNQESTAVGADRSLWKSLPLPPGGEGTGGCTLPPGSALPAPTIPVSPRDEPSQQPEATGLLLELLKDMTG